MTETQIHRLSMGACSCYLIKEEGTVLVDTGSPNQGQKFLNTLQRIPIEPKDVSLILLTHGHWDHIASANELRTLTGARVAINHLEKDWVEQALKPLPPGKGLRGKFSGLIMKMYVSTVEFPGTPVDIVLEDKEFNLEPFGIHGRILYTPGHSLGSMSLLLDTGEAFVGDSVMNVFPLWPGVSMPVFAEDTGMLKESLQLLLGSGAKWIYPAHGRP
ncbi:MAG: MBL fold metallo-hydrolase, partial [Dehalococcoidales bacterium]